MAMDEHPAAGIRSVHESIRVMVENSGYEYVGSELATEEGHSVLSVYIDSLGGINVKDCEIVSRRLGKMLDEIDPGLPERYFLEVSSPGVERPLLVFSDYLRFAGKKVRLKLKDPLDERRTLVGIIDNAVDGEIVLQEEEAGSIVISFDRILKANLVFELKKPEKPG
ncbi:MAG: ribosome maturation factor RimP, partial [Synergistales bacterium]|nr:ribosome maturation factor RimP [Synergistales bacterium]